jgi:hypothetical protein
MHFAGVRGDEKSVGAVRFGGGAPALYIPAPDWHRQARYRQYRPGTGCTDRPGTDSADKVHVVLAGAVGPGDWAPALYIPATDSHRQARYRQYRPSTGCTEWSSGI